MVSFAVHNARVEERDRIIKSVSKDVQKYKGKAELLSTKLTSPTNHAVDAELMQKQAALQA